LIRTLPKGAVKILNGIIILRQYAVSHVAFPRKCTGFALTENVFVIMEVCVNL
jgi:hypothetical protein